MRHLMILAVTALFVVASSPSSVSAQMREFTGRIDKVNKKLHLSKIKHAKFNESGQLLAFFLMSLFWAGDILLR